MSLFTRSYNRFTGGSSTGSGSSSTSRNEQNITHRKKLSAVSTSINGDDGMVAASPRNRNPPRHLKIAQDETDGARISTNLVESTPVEQKAAELRKNIEKNHAAAIESANAPSSSAANNKKPRTSTSSLASVFRSRASSPIEKMRKFIGRSSSKSAIQKAEAAQETQEVQSLKLEKVERSQQCDKVSLVDIGIMTEEVVETNSGFSTPKSDKENMNPQKMAQNSPEIICLEDNKSEKERIISLENELTQLRHQIDEQREDFRRTRKDFILILREAVMRKDEAEKQYEKLTKSIAEEEDWSTLMSQHRHTLRRNVLLMWAQKKLEPYSDELTVTNFSSDWTDCRAFCALIYDLFPQLMPDVTVSPIIGDCISRCRSAFSALELRFEERSLGLTGADSTDDSSTISSSMSLPDWRYVMDTVFEIYKRGTRF
ncbi:unnamed protein product [Caenorhabditis angaria]|uniref:Calponin-homology (CH) domain-containing protein n=1 Tax=Caenorhabditis angaria TaxID=860376 RepID=A0A9P1IJ16_9PELO|nr:unnamed protein product [Caenorhabditis angaria]